MNALIKSVLLFSSFSLIIRHVYAFSPSFNLPKEWHLWKEQHRKHYSNQHEELERHVTWMSNQAFIDAHNYYQDLFGFTLGMNQFGDMSDYEFQSAYSCTRQPYYNLKNGTKSEYLKTYQRPSSHNLTLPESMDWRSMGIISKPRSQGTCCSCYAFGALGSLEGISALATGKLVELSPQNVIDCSHSFGNRGCQKGSTENTYSYIIENNGIDTYKSYPYRGKREYCHFKKNTVGATMRYIVQIGETSEKDLQSAVAYQGPIAVEVDASHNLFRFYQGGLLNIPNCSSYKVTQALLVIGYGQYRGRDYWLVKNSWGETWGAKGFGLMSRNKYNQCGIATHATFPGI